MELTVTKKIDDKIIVWFKNSNQYLVLDPTAASVVNDLSKKKDIKTITTSLEKKLNIPFNTANNFIKDLNEKIVQPNTSSSKSVISDPLYDVPTTFLFEKYYQINSKVISVCFSNEFELSLIHPKIAHLEIPKTYQVDFSFHVFNTNENTFLILDDVFIGSWSIEDIHYFQGKFSMKIIECIYEKNEEKWMGVFHASAINYKEDSLLILGDSGNGKSTSLALLQANGYQCIADDFVPIDTALKIHTFPAGISIKKNSLPLLLENYPELKSSAEYHYERLNKVVRYLPPKNIDYKKTYPCKALVFIKYDETTPIEISKISSLDGFEKLVPDSWISSIPENVTFFLNWFSSLPCYQLTYSDNQLMQDSIKRIFKDEL